MSLTDDFVCAVESATGTAGKRQGKETRLRCPAHDDKHPSLDVSEGDDGRPLVTCRSAGCSFEQICAALGRELRDFMPRTEPLRSESYVYRDSAGNPLFRVHRKVEAGGKAFPQERYEGGQWVWGLKDTRRVLYRLPEIQGQEVIHVAEGEKCADALASLGIAATTNPMGAGKWRTEYAEQLVIAGAETIVIWADCDPQGREHAAQVAESVEAAELGVRCVELYAGRDDGYDVADLLAEGSRNGNADDLRGWIESMTELAEREIPERWLLLAQYSEQVGQVAGSARDSGTYLFTGSPPRGTSEQEQVPSSTSELVYGREQVEPLGPFALSLEEFIAEKSVLPPALVGDEDEILLPATGLMLLFAKGGRGKTTLIVEAALHFASGIEWLGFKVERPLRILLIENEGPREPFRMKLALKRELWAREISGAVFVHTLDWGAFSLASVDASERLRAFVEQHRIDLVVGDPLDSLGMEGVGSPDETRRFMALMSRVGLFRDVAFLLLHHPRKESAEDELDEAAGAWGGKPDTVLRLDKREGNRARLSFPKVRWSRRGTRPALILAFDPETEGFTVAHEEQADERDYVDDVAALLGDGTWRTLLEIVAKKNEGGIGASRTAVESILKNRADLFVSRNGKEVGRSARATVWQLCENDLGDLLS